MVANISFQVYLFWFPDKNISFKDLDDLIRNNPERSI